MESKEGQPQEKLVLNLNPAVTGAVSVALGTENRILTSVALDLIQEIYVKLLSKTDSEAEAHVKALYDKYYGKYMAESQKKADEVVDKQVEE